MINTLYKAAKLNASVEINADELYSKKDGILLTYLGSLQECFNHRRTWINLLKKPVMRNGVFGPWYRMFFTSSIKDVYTVEGFTCIDMYSKLSD